MPCYLTGTPSHQINVNMYLLTSASLPIGLLVTRQLLGQPKSRLLFSFFFRSFFCALVSSSTFHVPTSQLCMSDVFLMTKHQLPWISRWPQKNRRWPLIRHTKQKKPIHRSITTIFTPNLLKRAIIIAECDLKVNY